jgi:hypothetical protein
MKIITGLLIIIMVAFIFACDTTDLSEQAGTETLSISITPADKALLRGAKESFSVKDNNKKVIKNSDCYWSIDETDRNDGTEISPSGDLTIADNEDTPKKITIRAVLKGDETISATATVNLLAPEVESVQISTESSYCIADWTENYKIDVGIGTTEQFSAKVIGKNDPWNDVTWEIDGEKDGIRIDENGLLSVADDISLNNSTFIIKAVSVERGNKESEKVTVTIKKPIATDIKIVFYDNNGKAISIKDKDGNEINIVKEVGTERTYIFDVIVLGTGKVDQDVNVGKERKTFERSAFDDKIIPGYNGKGEPIEIIKDENGEDKEIVTEGVPIEVGKKILAIRGVPCLFNDDGNLVEIDDKGLIIVGDGNVNDDDGVITVTINEVEKVYEEAKLMKHCILKPDKITFDTFYVVIINKEDFSSSTKITKNVNKSVEYNLYIDIFEEFGTFTIKADSLKYDGMSNETPEIKIAIIDDEFTKPKQPR